MGLELGLLWCSMQLDPPLVIGDLPPRLTFPSKVGYYAVTESVERILLNINYKKDSLKNIFKLFICVFWHIMVQLLLLQLLRLMHGWLICRPSSRVCKRTACRPICRTGLLGRRGLCGRLFVLWGRCRLLGGTWRSHLCWPNKKHFILGFSDGNQNTGHGSGGNGDGGKNICFYIWFRFRKIRLNQN